MIAVRVEYNEPVNPMALLMHTMLLISAVKYALDGGRNHLTL